MAFQSPSSRVIQRSLQGVVVGVLVVGVLLGNLGIIVNAVVALGVTVLPAVLRRDFDVYLSTPLTLWIVGAVTLHAIGMVGLYDRISWWDHLTHFVSAGMVAGVGYAVTAILDEHSDAIHFPRSFLTVYIFLFTVAAGVFWEMIEMVGRELARAFGFEAVLVVYGLEDTMMDLLFDIAGAIVIAVAAGDSVRDFVTLPTAWYQRERR